MLQCPRQIHRLQGLIKAQAQDQGAQLGKSHIVQALIIFFSEDQGFQISGQLHMLQTLIEVGTEGDMLQPFRKAHVLQTLIEVVAERQTLQILWKDNVLQTSIEVLKDHTLHGARDAHLIQDGFQLPPFVVHCCQPLQPFVAVAPNAGGATFQGFPRGGHIGPGKNIVDHWRVSQTFLFQCFGQRNLLIFPKQPQSCTTFGWEVSSHQFQQVLSRDAFRDA
mmetsp:Transcript_63965/g.104893  ORF Transcript_63965/g.104893 Transcript_63965/m.104893 type:complete len:221 (+) Transcript_63965:1221-1883(+)